jgi:uncharacterized membrane protein YidH (DUF202 family)
MTQRSDENRHGAQVERTTLAWNRAAIAVAANGALILRAGFLHDLVVLEVVGVTVALIGCGVWALSLVRYTAIAGESVPHLFGRKPVSAVPLAAFVLLLSVVDLAVVVFTR